MPINISSGINKMLGSAFAEATAIYGLLVSILLIFFGVK